METNFSLSWDSYQKNICNGLSALQQNGEFVDMTLAADGHHVKVHQLVMSLVSPYIKDLISTAQCPHPVIFFNDVSHRTLISILEYIYTGEVQINKANLPDVIKAARALHIKGLMELVDVDCGSVLEENQSTNDLRTIRIKDQPIDNEATYNTDVSNEDAQDESYDNEGASMAYDETYHSTVSESANTVASNTKYSTILKKSPSLQFTASNRGNLQMILNRFMYHLRYSGKNSAHRRWQCVDHETPNRCNACVITMGDTLVKRLGAHNHPLHDQKILRKTQTSKIYTNIRDVEIERKNIKCSLKIHGNE